jgi:Methylase involved in ubiquinone/menaquinone biosynthesis
MNEQENNSIHDFDFSLICEYFASIKRQGPGSESSTHQAIAAIPGINPSFRIADIGCGTGSSAIQLAEETGASVLAIDLFPDFLDRLKQNAERAGVSDRLSTLQADMTSLDLEGESLDLIWSEGAIYNIGFEKGLREWRRFLKQGGCIAVTESTWLTDSRPAEIEDFWMDAYPLMDTLDGNIAKMKSAGYRVIKTAVLPEECWTKEFYEPQVLAQEMFLKRHPNDFTANELVRNQRHEAELYSKYKQYYGYVWYIGQKI